MDLELYETGNGGDILKTKKDLSVIDGLSNMPYLALFGGNTESSTKETTTNEQRFDYWANSFMPEVQQFNSETERVLNSVALTSSGREAIQRAVLKDLSFMKEFCNVEATVNIGLDRVEIKIILTEPRNQQRKEFTFIWDATLRELTSESRERYLVEIEPPLPPESLTVELYAY